MKKNVFLAMALLALMTVGVFAQEYTSESYFKVRISDNKDEIWITGFTPPAAPRGTDQSLVVNIPPTIQNMPVTLIGNNAFANNKRITSVTIPNGVRFIYESAFGGCPNLESVTIPATVVQIGLAFGGCPKIARVTFLGTIPNNNNSFHISAFSGLGIREKFYETDKTNGTPGTYTRSGTTWTKQ